MLKLMFSLCFVVALYLGNASAFYSKSAISNEELAKISRKLHKSDRNGAVGIELNFQKKTKKGNRKDNAPLPLFDHIPEEAMEAETITALMALYDNYEDNVQVPEVVTEEEEVENNAFLDAVVKTAVMQQAHAFLASKGLADPKMTVFKEYLRTIWFGMYSRSRGVEGSSGIEHVYIGEMKHGISGLHSWVRFATEEKKGDINYLGFLSVIDLGENKMIEMPMNWKGVYKPISSISVGGSPELELALSTICFLARPNKKCKLEGPNGVEYKYQTYVMKYKGIEYVGTAYPTV